MKIAINAISKINGGEAVVLEKLLKQFVRLRPDHEYLVIANTALVESARVRHEQVSYHHFPRANQNDAFTTLWYLTGFPLWLKQNKVDLLFSHTGFSSPLAGTRSAMLLQDARYFFGDDRLSSILPPRERWYFGLKKIWLYHSVRTAERITVQSHAMADLVAKKIPQTASRIRVIQHGPGYLDECHPRPLGNRSVNGSLEIVYVSLYRTYKNFRVLFRALRILKAKGIPTRLHLTLDRQEADVRALLDEAEASGLSDEVINHGVLSHSQVAKLYRGAHVVVFPSICESFGFPQVEAMALGLPLVVADTAINREICGPVGNYFAPNNQHELAAILDRMYRHPDELASGSSTSMRRGASFSWSRAASETLQWLEDPDTSSSNAFPACSDPVNQERA